MANERSFSFIFDPEVRNHLRSIDKKYHSLIRKEVEEQLQFEPEIVTRNRKPLRQSAAFAATWELRCGPDNRFRVLYAVDAETQKVQILAIGIKDKNRLFVGGKEVEL